MGEQGVALPLMKRAVLAGEPAVLAAAHLVERVARVAQDVELVEDDARLRRVARESSCETASTCPSRRAGCAPLLRAQRGKEVVQVRFGASLAADPDRPPAIEVADHDAVVVPLADGDLVHADRPRRGQAGRRDLLCM